VPTGTPRWNGSPFYYTWHSGHYLKGEPKIWNCPSDRYFDQANYQLRLYSSQKDSRTSYFMNRDMPNIQGVMYPPPYDHVYYFNPHPMSGIKPTQLIVFGEVNCLQQVSLCSIRSTADIITRDWRFDHRKNSAMSVAFADGHADQLSKTELLLRNGETNADMPARLRSYWFGSPALTAPIVTTR
jgi:prepilin-type processing-associated H-X9-DG protein